MPTPKGPAGKIPFTEKTIQAIARLPFDLRPVGVDDDGALITEPVAATVLDYFVRDARQPGFALRLTRAGARTWYAERKLAGRVCRYKCGDFATTALTKARDKAVLALAQIDQGIDPNHLVKDAKRRTQERHNLEKLTFGLMMTRDAERRANAAEGKADTFNTARDRRNTIKVVKAQPAWAMSVSDVTASDLDTLLLAVRKKHGDTTAIKVWRYARAAFGRLASNETPPVNPFAEFLKSHDGTLPRAKRRNTFLPTDEQAGHTWLRFIAAQRHAETAVTTGHPWTRAVMADYIILTLCWGARKMEGMGLKWSDVDFDRKLVAFRETKTKSDHYFPMTPGVEAILRRRQEENAKPRGRDVERAKKGVPIPVSEYVFPTERRTAKSGHITGVQSLLDLASEESGTYVTLHDLRRSFAGDIALDVLTGDGTGRGDFRLVKLAMNHAEQNADMTQTYIMLRPKLRVLTPIYAAHERRILGICGIDIPGDVPGTAGLLDAVRARAATDPAMQEQLRALLATPKA